MDMNETDILSVQGMLPYLSNDMCAEKILIYNTLESTNKTAKEMAVAGCEHGTVVIADSQTAGRGRYERSFYSPPESGLYMSFILHTGILNLSSTTMITIYTAVAVCRAVLAVCGKEPKIKWVNDLLLNDKKICGILAEAVTDVKSRNVDWIVIGIGLNVTTCEDDFPDDLNKIAGSIYPKKMERNTRNHLAAEIINRILSLNTWQNDEETYMEYKRRSMVLGNKITILTMNKTYEATAVDIDKNGKLIIKKEDGSTAYLSSGEVSIKKYP